jgi:hypothetical protein
MGMTDTKTDATKSSAEALRYPWENHPGPDQVVEIMPGVLWVRLKLPFRLNHVNIYLLADSDGWAMVSIARFTCRRSNICNRSITRTAAPKNASRRSGGSFAATAWTRA